MRLLLTHGYFIADDVKEQNIMKPYVPLGLLYLSSHLRSKGMEVEIYDSTSDRANTCSLCSNKANPESSAFTAIL